MNGVRLTELLGIFVDDSLQDIEYVHLLFDQHEIITAHDVKSESLFTSPETGRHDPAK